MAELVPTDQIEGVVGVPRHPTRHFARAVSAERTVYILHPHSCLELGIDLRGCAYSVALDRGIDLDKWVEDVPLLVTTEDGHLVPDPSEVTW